MRAHARVAAMVAQEVERGFVWAPVFFSVGILVYFHLGREPPVEVHYVIAGLSLMCLVTLRRAAFFPRAVLWASVLIMAGFAAAQIRARAVAAPVLDYRYYGPVEGRVVALDRSAAGALRVTLDQVALGVMPFAQVPERVRISLYGPDALTRPAPGARIMTTAHLSPPNGPVEPGGFDFQRHAWFQQLGGLGYSRVPVLLAASAPHEWSFFALRQRLSARVRDVLDGQVGAFGAALISGDRSALTPETLDALRQTNLAHLLAISGLHMGLLAGFIFGSVRLFLLLVPALSRGGAVKRIAAGCAVLAGFGYLGLSGGAIATERAFIMAAVMLGAVMLGRRAISFRAVAIAAMILLIHQPEALIGPGFQMSFAATVALVAVFSAMAAARAGKAKRSAVRRWITGSVTASAVAGLATLPIAAAHFNQIVHFGLVANLVSVPVMGVMIMPLAVIAVCLMPFGLDAPVLRLMGYGLHWILQVADHVQSWPHAITKVPAPPNWALATMCFGMLVVALGVTRLRYLGSTLVVIAVIGWSLAERPAILIDDTGKLVGIMSPEGRRLSREKGAGFVAEIWLENDGDAADQAAAWARWSTMEPKATVLVAQGRRGLAAFSGCTRGQIAVFSETAPDGLPCEVFDKPRLRRTGSVAITWTPSGERKITSSRDLSGHRYWNDAHLRASVLQDQ